MAKLLCRRCDWPDQGSALLVPEILGDPSPQPERKDRAGGWTGFVARSVRRPAVYRQEYYHPANWRKRLDFGTAPSATWAAISLIRSSTRWTWRRPSRSGPKARRLTNGTGPWIRASSMSFPARRSRRTRPSGDVVRRRAKAAGRSTRFARRGRFARHRLDLRRHQERWSCRTSRGRCCTRIRNSRISNTGMRVRGSLGGICRSVSWAHADVGRVGVCGAADGSRAAGRRRFAFPKATLKWDSAKLEFEQAEANRSSGARIDPAGIAAAARV